MMVDIFQYSNMYTLKSSISRLAADETIISECGTYVARRGSVAPSWPILLRLYSKLLPGVTVHQWIEENDVLNLQIDPRRFCSFGIIKGFLRRVRRWPVLVDQSLGLIEPPDQTRRKVEFDTSTRLGSGTRAGDSSIRAGDSTFTLRSTESNVSLGVSPASYPARASTSFTSKSPARRHMNLTQVSNGHAAREAFSRSVHSAADTQPSNSSRRTLGSKSAALKIKDGRRRLLESEMMRYLDGNHSADEIQVMFGISWSQLEKLLGLDEIKDGKGRTGVSVILR